MILSVSVDELDINSVSKDQEAEVTLDALEDSSFTGTVTKVGSSSQSSGNGVAKYTVEITIPKDADERRNECFSRHYSRGKERRGDHTG